jgi:predicted nucleotidyltransferase
MSAISMLAAKAREMNLSFLLIGGHAVNLHGYSRFTKDIDLLIRRDDLPRWRELLREAGYELQHQAATFLQFDAEKAETPGVDLMLVNRSTYEKMIARAISAQPDGTAIHFVCAEHLIALKLHVLKQDLEHRRLKDFLDIVEVVRAKKIDLQSAEMREIFSRYGTEDLYRRIRLAVE